MKIVILRTGMPNGDSRLLKTACALKRSGHDVVLLCWDRGSTYRTKTDKVRYVNDRFKVVTIGIKAERGVGFKKLLPAMLRFHIRAILWLIRNRKSFDVIHANDLDTGLCALILQRVCKKKYVYDIYDFYSDSRTLPKKLIRAIRSLEHIAIKEAEATIICSEARSEQIKGSKPKMLSVIYNSPDPESLNIGLPVAINMSNKINIVFVGMLVEGRFIDEMLEVLSERNEFVLHIGGYGNPKIEQTIKCYSQSCNNIKYYGSMKYEEVISLESACDIMIALYDPTVPNSKYASPNKFFEALMLGKPIIMVKDTGFADVVEQNGFGITIEFSKQGLEYGLDSIKEFEFEKVAIRMKAEYRKNYSWAEMRTRIEEIYQKIENSMLK